MQMSFVWFFCLLLGVFICWSQFPVSFYCCSFSIFFVPICLSGMKFMRFFTFATASFDVSSSICSWNLTSAMHGPTFQVLTWGKGIYKKLLNAVNMLSCLILAWWATFVVMEDSFIGQQPERMDVDLHLYLSKIAELKVGMPFFEFAGL